MNKRSFKRGMEPPPCPEGWQRTEQKVEKGIHYKTVEDGLRDLFERLLAQAMAHMEQDAAEGRGTQFNSWGIIRSKNGQEFKISIEGLPPTVPGNPDLN